MQFTKHIHVLHLLSTIPVGKDACTAEEAVAAWDHMFDYIHNHWAKPLTAAGQVNAFTAGEMSEVVGCRELLQMSAEEITEKLSTRPPYFTESLFPVAVARYMLRELAIPLNHRLITTFSEFRSRYGRMILA